MDGCAVNLFSMTGDTGKTLVHRYFEELAGGDLSEVDDIVAAEHGPAVIALMQKLRRAFPDFHCDVRDVIAEGDLVAASFIASGTHLGPWDGPVGVIAPTGRHFEQEGVRMFRVADGRLVETWGGADTVAQLRQLGVLSAVAQPRTARR
jgi:predicted ester cyclase